MLQTPEIAVRSRGFALDNGTTWKSSCLSAAVVDADANLAAALSVVLTTNRLTTDHHAISSALLAAAVELSRDLRSLDIAHVLP